MYQQDKQSPYDQLLDTTKNNAIARGAKAPEWSDVWIAMTSTEGFYEALRQRGISPSDLSTEINYLTKFSQDAIEKVDAGIDPKKAERALTELMEELSSYLEAVSAEHEDPVLQAAIKDILFYLMDKTQAETRRWSSNPEDREFVELKDRISKHVMGNAMSALFGKIMIGLSSSMTNPEMMKDLKEELAETMGQELSEKLHHLLFHGKYTENKEESHVIAQLESLRHNPISSPSPVEVIDYVIGESGDLYQNLLYRNGLRSNDADRVDLLDSVLPTRRVQGLMLNALDLAYSYNSRKLNTRHLVLTLLRSSDVRIHLSRLGIKDLQEFEEEFRKHSIDMDEKPKGRISIHTEIGDDMRELAKSLNEFYEKGRGAPEALHSLIRGDAEISKALNKAGLRTRMLKGWKSAYEAKEIKNEDDVDPEEKEKKKTGYEISDHHLESLIKEYCVDQTMLARKKKFDPMIGNEDLVEQITTKMLKRGRKNPIILGEPGVGKSKVLEGLSQAIIKGKVPEELVGARLLSLDLHQMSDSPFVGVFESRILPIIKGIAERNAAGTSSKILLAVDEFAEVQDAGGRARFKGLIKPYLTSGEIFLIAATTEEEYRTKVEKDPALARRLQPVYVKEPTVEETAGILSGIKRKYSTHHKLRIADSLMPFIADKAARYIHTINQPDKSIDLFDEACALAHKEKSAVLTQQHILRAVSAKTNIPLDFLSESDNIRYANLETNVEKRVIGQSDAIKTVASALKRSKAGFGDANAPIGNFLFVGPTGVGKTELSKALTEFLFGDANEFLIRFDMGEFQDQAAATRFTGANPQFVGYEEGGLLVKKVRGKPFSVVLYDEIEKAHPTVLNVLLAPFSDGILTDGRGMKADFRNTLNIMTSNIGAADVMAEGRRLGLDPIKDHKKWQEMSRPIYENAVNGFFSPEFRNRMDGIIYFNSLNADHMQELVKRRFNQTAEQLKNTYGLQLELAAEFNERVLETGFDVTMGARPLKRAWAEQVETPLSDWLLRQNLKTIGRAKKLLMDVQSRLEIDQVLSGHENVIDIRGQLGRVGEITPGFHLKRG